MLRILRLSLSDETIADERNHKRVSSYVFWCAHVLATPIRIRQLGNGQNYIYFSRTHVVVSTVFRSEEGEQRF